MDLPDIPLLSRVEIAQAYLCPTDKDGRPILDGLPSEEVEYTDRRELIFAWWRKRGFLEHQIERIYQDTMEHEAILRQAAIDRFQGGRNERA